MENRKREVARAGLERVERSVPAWTLRYPPPPGCVPPSGLCALSPHPPVAARTSGPSGGSRPPAPASAAPEPSAPSRSPRLHRWDWELVGGR